MKAMIGYDLMETIRSTNEWMGATARAMASSPAWGLAPHPMFQMMAAWGRVAERSFSRMVMKPDWGIRAITMEDGTDHLVEEETLLSKPFCDLIHFKVHGRAAAPRRVLVIAPMSGHYATLARSTVTSLIPDCEVYVTDWKNARDIPVSAGRFDVEDFTLYLIDFIRHLGPDINVVAICQPAPLALAATAVIAEETPEAQPRSLVLIGGPIDPDAADTEVTDFGSRVTLGQLEQTVIQRVGFNYAGAGRMVYPGLMQLASFIAMNADKHIKAFQDEIIAEAKGEASDQDRHNIFYDEYLAVMDMTAEFYLSTVERIFQKAEIGRGTFTLRGRPVDPGRITRTAVFTVEGEKDDITAPGQCIAALDLCTALPEDRKASHLEPGAGHYGIFAGKSWRNHIRPILLDFFDKFSAPVSEVQPKTPTRRSRRAA
ncbi:polyhydroxyalkanoate depolymerase [Paenirhodobacter populi]|uniref:Polyhydroxyalkanoate depolymerase n=1 Tax=Paenirhodobacter populi TaxID=2306993 RepID=A0A443J1K7_9RHOB|nr:polyhydroxyalkanoate depolymerase [Sinirhodobacter populi]RWR14501.1 polyhydroxyalkanoate depolymerase [Sinirhodobacter populi]